MSSKVNVTRRGLLISFGAAAAISLLAISQRLYFAQPEKNAGPTTSTVADRERRMEWWHEARFGMFIHFGLYSVLGAA